MNEEEFRNKTITVDDKITRANIASLASLISMACLPSNVTTEFDVERCASIIELWIKP